MGAVDAVAEILKAAKMWSSKAVQVEQKISILEGNLKWQSLTVRVGDGQAAEGRKLLLA